MVHGKVRGSSHYDETLSKHSQNMLRLHCRMGHIPFRKIQLLAEQGSLPKEYAKCDIPVCSSCLYAKMGKRPWRNKLNRKHPPERKQLQPGEVVAVDQMVSPTHGFVAQMTGILTGERYKYATVFVDQGSRLGYVYIQKSASAEETIKAKMAFKVYAKNHGVSVQAYHADNGIFRAKAWMDHCFKRDQGMTFAGVNVHHQNGMAEKRIRDYFSGKSEIYTTPNISTQILRKNHTNF